MKKVAVITALWYEDKYLPALFASLEATDYPRAAWEIIMIDNRNSDVTRRWVAANVAPKIGQSLPVFTLLPAGNNTGFAAGNNACMKLALEHECDAVYLLNEDARGDSQFLKEAVRALENDSRLGAVQSFLLLDPVTSGVNSIGNGLHFLGFSFCEGYKMPRHDAEGYLRVQSLANPRHAIVAASGAAVLYSAAALREVGFFDESFFMYHEDLDLSLRLREAGYGLALAPASRVFHHYDFNRSIDKYYWMERNRFRLVLEHYKLATLLLLFPGFAAAELGLVFFSLANGTLSTRLKAYAYILDPRHWAEIAAAREAHFKLRKISDRELLQSAVARISYQEFDSPTVRLSNKLMAAYWFVAKRLIYW